MQGGRGGVKSAPWQRRVFEFTNYPGQPTKSAEHMQSMSYGQHVEESETFIGSKVKSMGSELHPSKGLSCHKEKPEEQRYIEPARHSRRLTPRATHVSRDLPTRQSERTTACQHHAPSPVK